MNTMYDIMHTLLLITINLQTKFETPGFTRCKDMKEDIGL